MVSVLWADPSKSCDALVAALRTRHIAVDVVNSGMAVLSRLRNTSFDVIILDMALSDIAALAVLSTINTARSSARVLVLADKGDFPLAMEAIRLGAVGVRLKPLSSHELVEVVAVIAATCPPRVALPVDMSERRGLKPVITHLRVLESGISDDGADSRTSAGILRVLASALLDRQLTVTAFIACAAAFRSVIAQGTGNRPTSEQAAGAISCILDVLGVTAEPTTEKVSEAIATADASVRCGKRLSATEIGASLGVSAVHLERIIRSESGLTFTQWRTALAVRVAAIRLAETDSLVTQIAYSVGFEHASQFIREFERLLGLTPKRYRRLSSAPAAGNISI